MAARVSVAVYLSSVLDQPPRNCGAFLCGWVKARRGVDPAPWAADLDVRAWLCLLRDEPAGLVGLADRIAADAGVEPVTAARVSRALSGAGGIVEIPASNGRVRQACALLDDGLRWTVLSASQGLIGSRAFTPLRIWVV